jgi:hypothetical protein
MRIGELVCVLHACMLRATLRLLATRRLLQDSAAYFLTPADVAHTYGCLMSGAFLSSAAYSVHVCS